jgi:radical S-adenosyl methionine domain-containing protein 2
MNSNDDLERFEDTANLYLLTACDMTCSFCYASKGLGRFSLDELREILDTLVEHGASHVNLTGGEPLLHPDVFEVVRYADQLGLRITFFTSGSMLTPEAAAEICRSVEWVALSLDGTREMNLAVGRGEGHYEAALRSIELLRSASPSTLIRVTSVATRINASGLSALAGVLRGDRHRPDLWRIKQMVPTRRAGDHRDDLGVTDQEFDRHMAEVMSVLPEGFPVQLHGSQLKSGDTMCIHPGGEATVTIGDGTDMEIVPLGNVLRAPRLVFREWNSRRDASNAGDYNRMWARSSPVTLSPRRV